MKLLATILAAASVLLFSYGVNTHAADDAVQVNIDCGSVEIGNLSPFVFGATAGPYYDPTGLALNKQAGLRLMETVLHYDENAVSPPVFTGSTRQPNSITEVKSIINESLRQGMEIMAGFATKKAPSDPFRYQNTIKQQVRELQQVAASYRRTIQFFRFGNEPEIHDFWQGTMDDYFRTFELWYRAVKAAAPNAVIVAAGFANPVDDTGSPAAYTESFVQYCANRGLSLDILAFHGYGVEPSMRYGRQFEVMRELLNGYPAISGVTGVARLANNEWNLITPYPSAYDPVFDTAWAGAHNVAALIGMIRENAYLCVRFGGAAVNVTSPNGSRDADFLLVHRNYGKKPSFHAMQGLSRFVRHPVIVSSSVRENDNFNVLAGMSPAKNALYVAVCNYPYKSLPSKCNPDYDANQASPADSPYSLSIAGLPFPAGKVQVTRYRVDSSNVGQVVENSRVPANGGLSLQYNLPGPGIDFILIVPVK